MNKTIITEKLKKAAPVLAVAAVASVAGAEAVNGLDPTEIANSAKSTITNVATAGGTLLAVSVGVRVGVKWVKRMVGMS